MANWELVVLVLLGFVCSSLLTVAVIGYKTVEERYKKFGLWVAMLALLLVMVIVIIDVLFLIPSV